jgi:hypothetical protein
MPKAPFHCAYCGKAAHKRTTTVYVQEPAAEHQLPGNQFARHVIPDAYLTCKADCARYTNGQVVSVSYSTPTSWGSKKPRHIHRFSEWDGESWELNNGIFCHAECATDFAVAAFKAGYRMARKAA